MSQISLKTSGSARVLVCPVRDKFAQAACRALDTAGPVDQTENVAFAPLAAELFGDDDVIVAGEAGAAVPQPVFVNQTARYAVKQDIVADADQIGVVKIIDAVLRLASDFTCKLFAEHHRLFVGQRLRSAVHRRARGLWR